MSIKELAQGRSDIYRLDPNVINVRPNWNSRDFSDVANAEHVDMLAKSIAEVGVKEPLTVVYEDGKIYLVDGECRWRGTMRAMEVYNADIKTVPVKTEERFANDADRLFSQIVRNSGKPFTALENARVYKRLLDMGWQQIDIAKKAGLSQSRISQVLELLTMPESIKAMVTNGTVSASLATKTIAEHKNPEQVLSEAVVSAKAEGKSRVLPKHVEQLAPKPRRTANSVVADAFESANIDDTLENVVIVTFPVAQWEKIRDALKL